jgi:hypothetical protein
MFRQLKDWTRGWCNNYSDSWGVEAWESPKDVDFPLESEGEISVCISGKYVQFTSEGAKEFVTELQDAINKVEAAGKEGTTSDDNAP